MNRLTTIQRECLDIVRDEYGVMDARLVPGGKHPQLKFTYAGASYSKVLPHGNIPDFGRSANNYAAWLRRDLGDPPVKPARVKRNLEDMMPTINDLIDPQQRAGLEAMSAARMAATNGLGLPDDVTRATLAPPDNHPAERSEVFRGTVSVRRASTDSNWARLRLVIPENLYRAFAHRGQVRMTMSEPDNFEVVPVEPGLGSHLPVFGSRGRGSYEFSSERVVPLTPGLQFYGNSPAEILLVGGHLLVRVLEKTPYVPRPQSSRVAPPSPMGGIGSAAVTPPPAASRSLELPGPDTTQPGWRPSSADVRACLEALRGIEEFTDYRLVKLKEGEHQRWVFQARID